MELYDHQKSILEKNPKRCLFAWGTGTGKTYGSLALANKNVNSILVICPKSLYEKWLRDVEEFPGAKYEVITKENFRKNWDILDKYDALIVDEAHYFSGMKSAMSKALLAYNKKWNTVYIYSLTATPFLSTPWNIYRLAQMMGIRYHYLDFLGTFFYKIKLGKYPNAPTVTKMRPGMEKELAKYVHRIGDVVDIHDCADIPEQVFETEHFKTNKKQIALLKEVALLETNPAVKYTRYHQIENGTLKGDEYTENKFVNAAKHEYLMELINDNKKIAVFCRYNLQIDAIKDMIKDKKVFVIRGDVLNKDAVVQAVEEAEDCVVLINAACSEGYELPSVGVCVFASMSFSFKDYKQAQGRFLRINKLKKNVYIHLINKDSIDEAVYQSIMNKQDFDIEIYAKNK